MKNRVIFLLVCLVILVNAFVIGYSAYFLTIRAPIFTTHASSQGTLSFTIEEEDSGSSGTTGTTGTTGGGGGGGYGGETKAIELFSLDKEEINLFVSAGERSENYILITNKQNTPI